MKKSEIDKCVKNFEKASGMKVINSGDLSKKMIVEYKGTRYVLLEPCEVMTSCFHNLTLLCYPVDGQYFYFAKCEDFEKIQN